MLERVNYTFLMQYIGWDSWRRIYSWIK